MSLDSMATQERDEEAMLERVISKVLTTIREDESTLGSHRLAFNEDEAGRLLGVNGHVLGDARRLGKINHTRVGGRISYTRQQLMDYLESQSA